MVLRCPRGDRKPKPIEAVDERKALGRQLAEAIPGAEFLLLPDIAARATIIAAQPVCE
jgi:hypothetical protein